MFETYQFAGVYIAIQAVLTLYAQGKTTQQLRPFLKEPPRGRERPPGSLEFTTAARAARLIFSMPVWFL